jgi:hypothetical protein
MGDIEFWVKFVIKNSTILLNLILEKEIYWVMGSHLSQQDMLSSKLFHFFYSFIQVVSFFL